MIRSVHIDGWLFVWIGILTAIIASLSSDNAAKYIRADILWYLQSGITSLNAGLLACKMYRSTSFAKDKQERTETEFIKKMNTPGSPTQ